MFIALLFTAFTYTSSANDVELTTLVEYRGAIDACYEQALASTPELTGKMTYGVLVDSHGDVLEITSTHIIFSEVHDSVLEDCVFEAVELGRFIAPRHGAISTYNDRVRVDMEEDRVQDSTDQENRSGTITIVLGDYKERLADVRSVIEPIDLEVASQGACVEQPPPSRRRRGYRTPSRRRTGYKTPKGVDRNSDLVTYTAVPGDALADIAKRYGVPLSLLTEWNGLCEDTVLRENRDVLIWIMPYDPCAAYASGRIVEPGSERIIYSAAGGERLSSIADRYGLPMEAFLVWNGYTTDTTLNDGDEIIIWVAPLDDGRYKDPCD